MKKPIFGWAFLCARYRVVGAQLAGDEASQIAIASKLSSYRWEGNEIAIASKLGSYG